MSDDVVTIAESTSPTPWRRLVRRFSHNPTAVIGLVFLAVLAFVAVFATLVQPQNPATQHLTHLNEGPSSAHWLGTDDTGRDLLSRIVSGARVSMRVCAQVVVLAVLVALPLGLIAGYFGKWIDAVIMRVMDALFTFPPLMLALALAALLGPSLTNASIAIAIPFVPGFVRVLRAQVLAVREEAFIEASRSIGAGSGRMLRRHIFPNVASPLIVQVALSFGYALLAEAGLSFLGFGVQPPNASWGTMLQSAYQFINDKPWPLFPPGIAIALTVLAFNLVGDGLRDSLGREIFRAKGMILAFAGAPAVPVAAAVSEEAS
jgi:ABC-type dipeptide/oligopeptide/nickel transport system permease subunit